MCVCVEQLNCVEDIESLCLVYMSLREEQVEPCYHPDKLSIRTYISTYINRGADKFLARPTPRCILFDDENISFDASLIYINSTNIPLVMIISRIYEHQIFCRCSLFPSWSG